MVQNMFKMVLYLNYTYRTILVKDTVHVCLKGGVLDRIKVIRSVSCLEVKGLGKCEEGP